MGRSYTTPGDSAPECGSPLGDWRARIGYCCDYCLLRAEPEGQHREPAGLGSGG